MAKSVLRIAGFCSKASQALSITASRTSLYLSANNDHTQFAAPLISAQIFQFSLCSRYYSNRPTKDEKSVKATDKSSNSGSESVESGALQHTDSTRSDIAFPVDTTVRRCLRIAAYDKKNGVYVRCNKKFTEETNSPTSCRYHEIGLFDKIGPGSWWNCCKSTHPLERGCMVGYCSDQVDDSDLRGYSIDPRKPSDLDK